MFVSNTNLIIGVVVLLALLCLCRPAEWFRSSATTLAVPLKWKDVKNIGSASRPDELPTRRHKYSSLAEREMEYTEEQECLEKKDNEVNQKIRRQQLKNEGSAFVKRLQTATESFEEPAQGSKCSEISANGCAQSSASKMRPKSALRLYEKY